MVESLVAVPRNGGDSLQEHNAGALLCQNVHPDLQDVRHGIHVLSS